MKLKESGILIIGLALVFLMSGCGLVQDIYEPRPPHTKLSIIGVSGEKIAGKVIRDFEVRYETKSFVNNDELSGLISYLALHWATLESISFEVQDGNRQDFDKLLETLYTFLYHRYEPFFIAKKVGNTIRYYRNGNGIASLGKATNGKIWVGLSCPDACNAELLENLFEKNAVAPLSPWTKEDYNTLKSRL